MRKAWPCHDIVMIKICKYSNTFSWEKTLTHWGRVMHICTSNLTIIGSDNGLSPGRRHVIIWTNDGILLIRTFGANFTEILSEIHTFSFKKMDLKMSSVKWRQLVSTSMCKVISIRYPGMIGSVSGLALNRQQANTWTNVDHILFCDTISMG